MSYHSRASSATSFDVIAVVTAVYMAESKFTLLGFEYPQLTFGSCR